MSDQFELYAEVREDMGKGASRRLRRLADQVPAIIYGGDKDPQPLSIIRKDLEKSLENEAFFSHVLIININGKKEKAILKDLQRHPARNSVTHADFMRVSEKVAIKVHVPIHFLNEKTCHGVKVQGGMIQHQATDIEVLCLPSDIPEFIEVDMAEVKTGDIIHLSDIALPSGVTSVALSLGEDHDLAVASVVAPKGGSDAEEGSSEDSSSDSSSED
ncbi:MAG TPA: 50S ribosomal protein L25 [Halieaceae bacterium]|nr:50S ribosomal protein L25 [Halieaceae bacterium]|tara:strand:+ start:315 stop:962 length:648 start_codon:yes stop_codon:yes gene_type:complete